MHLLRSEQFDLLVFDLLVGQESGLGVALLAEFHQPHCATILVSDKDPVMQQELFARLSSLKSVLGTGTAPRDIVAISESIVPNEGRGCTDYARAVPEMCDNCPAQEGCVARLTEAETHEAYAASLPDYQNVAILRPAARVYPETASEQGTETAARKLTSA